VCDVRRVTCVHHACPCSNNPCPQTLNTPPLAPLDCICIHKRHLLRVWMSSLCSTPNSQTPNTKHQTPNTKHDTLNPRLYLNMRSARHCARLLRPTDTSSPALPCRRWCPPGLQSPHPCAGLPLTARCRQGSRSRCGRAPAQSGWPGGWRCATLRRVFSLTCEPFSTEGMGLRVAISCFFHVCRGVGVWRISPC
jgi:hypothetical protein